MTALGQRPIELVAISGFGNEYVTWSVEQGYQLHHRYRPGRAEPISEFEIGMEIIEGNLYQAKEFFGSWQELQSALAARVQTVHIEFTELPPSIALARASLPTLEGLAKLDSSDYRLVAMVEHLLSSQDVAAEDELSSSLRALIS